jgi:hypothetical protein
MRTSFDAAEADIPKPVLHIVRDLDGKHVDGHNRLRMEVQERERRLSDVEAQCATFAEQFLAVAKRTTDIQSLRFTPGMFAATIALCASFIGGAYASTSGLRDAQSATRTDITEIKTMIAAQAELSKANSKLQDERASMMSDAIKEIKARGEMTDLKVNNLRETVLTNRR